MAVTLLAGANNGVSRPNYVLDVHDVAGPDWLNVAVGRLEAETGLVRFGLRDYDPGTGRFVSRDPILFDGGQTNLFVFADGDPVNGSDPTGAGPSATTYSLGLDGSMDAGPFGVGLNISIAFDTSGDFGLQVTPSVGVGVGGGGNLSVAGQRADGTIKSNDGLGVSITADAGAGLNGGGSVSFDPKLSKVTAVKAKLGLGVGGAVSEETGYTGSITKNDVTGALSSLAEFAGL